MEAKQNMALPSCRKREAAQTDEAAIARLETAYQAWFEAHRVVPEMEIHSSDELAWMRGPGIGWSNAAVRLRLKSANADARLKAAFSRAFADGRGFGLWVSDLATPADLPARLGRFGFRNRKRFPAMLADLTKPVRVAKPLGGIEVCETEDLSIFARHPHPYFGPITSALRRFELHRMMRLCAAPARRVFNLLVLRAEVPVGAATVFVAGEDAVFFDVGVLESARQQGIGTGLMTAGCAFARQRGARAAMLLSSGMGYSMYLRAGFREVGQIAYWYSRAPSVPLF